jgi:subtilase family serine protease
LLLKPSPEQQAALEELLAAQQDSGSPQYRQWLSPLDFADRFAPSQRDLGQVTAWLQSQGFAVTQIAQSRNWIMFQGTAQQVESALRTEIHHCDVEGESHFANVSEPRIPEALAGLVSGIRGLHDFLPQALRSKLAPLYTPLYTSSSGYHYLAPDDLAAIYNLTALYNQGIDGTGQTLAVVGADRHQRLRYSRFPQVRFTCRPILRRR